MNESIPRAGMDDAPKDDALYAAYINTIKSRLCRSFDIGQCYMGVQYDIAAVCTERVEQTVLFQENVADWYERKEIVLLSRVSCTEDVLAARKEAQDIALKSADPQRHHRLTEVVRVLVMGNGRANPLDRERKAAARIVRHSSFARSFRAGFYGWARSCLVLVDLSTGRATAGWADRDKRKYFLP